MIIPRKGMMGMMVVVASATIGISRLGAQDRPGTTQATGPQVSAPGQSNAANKSKQTGKGTVTVIVKDSTVRYAVLEVARQAGWRAIYDDADTLAAKRISVRIVDAAPMQALAEILKGTGLVAVMARNGETVIIRKATASRSDMETTQDSVGEISGRVVDSARGEPVKGVTVMLKGTKSVAMTDDHGRFIFHKVPVGQQTVTFRLLGYAPLARTIPVVSGQMSPLVVTLVTSRTMLPGVVTTVTGTQRKVEVGNDITTINVDSVLRTAPVSNLTDLLETRVPGLTVIRSSGVPGAPSRLRLRGLGGGLLAGQEGAPTNDPIVVVDGIRINASQSSVSDQNLAGSQAARYNANYQSPSAIDQIDPNSIETIEVLKGPSASAMYGSDAANGVIVIKTKRGRSGPTQWSLVSNANLQYLPGVYAAPGYYPFCNRGGTSNPGGPQICTTSSLFSSFVDSVVRFQALDEPRLTSFGTGYGHAFSGTVSGGTPTMTYSVTGSTNSTLGLLKAPAFYQDQFRQVYDSTMPDWMRRPDRYQQNAGSANLSAEPQPGLRVTLLTRLTSSDQQQSSAQLQLAQLASAYFDTTSVSPTALAAYATKVTSDRFVFDNSVAASWDRWRLLPLTATVGFSRDTRNDTQMLPHGIISAYAPDSLGTYSAGTQTTNTTTAGFNGTLFPGRLLSISLGTDFTKQGRQQVQLIVDSLTRGVTTPTQIDQASQLSAASTTGGWFVEPRLNLNSRFFVNPGIRFDGNSASGNNGGANGGLWSLFPKLNFSWIALDREGEAPFLGVISMLRPRLSFGIAGVQPAPQWQLRLMQQTTSGGLLTIHNDGGLEIGTLGNTQLHPERTREFEGGFDVDLWNGRVTAAVTQFFKLRIDAIEEVPVPPSIYGGALEQYVNIGRVRNTGTEISLTAALIETQQVRWSMTAAISKYDNTLLALNNGSAYIDLGNGIRFVPGYPLDGRWSRPILGWATPSLGGRLAKSDVIIGDSLVYMGHAEPNFELPVSTSIALFHGMVSVDATTQYTRGMTQFNAGSQQQINNLYLNPSATLADQAAALAMAGCSGIYAQSSTCTNYGLIQTVNTLRLTSLSIGYNVPRTISRRLRIPSLSLALQGSNLGLWTSYRGKDPDVNSLTVGDALQDSGQLPTPRQWQLQVRIGN